MTSNRLSSLLAATPSRAWIARTVLVAAIAAMTFGCASRQPVQKKVIPVAKAATGAYVIGPDDVLEVIVWKEPELSSHQLTVSGDGTITEPLAGRIQAAGETTAEVQNSLTKALKPFVDNPNVTVRVVEARSQVIYVQGSVNAPGKYPLQSGEYLSQAIAAAGGLGQFADPSDIRIERHGPNKVEEITVDYRDVKEGESSAADLPLMKGDTIFVK